MTKPTCTLVALADVSLRVPPHLPDVIASALSHRRGVAYVWIAPVPEACPANDLAMTLYGWRPPGPEGPGLYRRIVAIGRGRSAVVVIGERESVRSQRAWLRAANWLSSGEAVLAARLRDGWLDALQSMFPGEVVGGTVDDWEADGFPTELCGSAGFAARTGPSCSWRDVRSMTCMHFCAGGRPLHAGERA